MCADIDECATEGGKFGHHCHSNTVCVNTVGSYQCQCHAGHNRLDAYTCEGTETSQHSSARPQHFHFLHFLLFPMAILGWLLPLCLTNQNWALSA